MSEGEWPRPCAESPITVRALHPRGTLDLLTAVAAGVGFLMTAPKGMLGPLQLVFLLQMGPGTQLPQ